MMNHLMWLMCLVFLKKDITVLCGYRSLKLTMLNVLDSS